MDGWMAFTNSHRWESLNSLVFHLRWNKSVSTCWWLRSSQVRHVKGGSDVDTMSCLQGYKQGGGKIHCRQQAVYSSGWCQQTWKGGQAALQPKMNSYKKDTFSFSGKSGWLCQTHKPHSHNQKWLGLWCFSFSPSNGGGEEQAQEAGPVLKPHIALCLNDLKCVCSWKSKSGFCRDFHSLCPCWLSHCVRIKTCKNLLLWQW